MHAHVREAGPQLIGCLLVEEGHESLRTVHQGDLDTQRREDRGVLTPDRPATDDDEAPGDAVDLEDGVGVVHIRVVERDLGRSEWPRPDRDEDGACGQAAHIARGLRRRRPSVAR